MLVTSRFEAIFACRSGRPFTQDSEEEWKHRAEGVVMFKMLTMQTSTLRCKDELREGYCPKMLLYVLDEMFHILDQVKWQPGHDEKLIIAYKVLCLAVLCCMDQWCGCEKVGVPDALEMLDLDDAQHLERLMWAVYDGALMVRNWLELPRHCSWCTMLADLHQHIYKSCDDAAHCPPFMTASWDCHDRTKVLHR